MLSLFYIVLVIALTSVGLLFYLLFRRRISLTIFRARGYFGVTLLTIAFITLIGCATAAGIWGNQNRHSPSELTDSQYSALIDWTDDYRALSDRLRRSYTALRALEDAIADDKMTYADALYEIDRQTDKTLVLKNSFAKLAVPRTLPTELRKRMEKMSASDTEQYERQLRLLLSLRQEVAQGAQERPSRLVSANDRKHIRLLILDQLPAHLDVNTRLYSFCQEVEDTYRQRHTR